MAERKTIKVALINPPPPPGAFVHYQNPLIGPAYLAAVLEKNGYEVKVFDCPPLGLTFETLKQEIIQLKPDIVGITSVTVTFSTALQTAKMVKETMPQTLIVMGGPHVTVLDEQVIKDNPAVDVIVRGEGEQTMLELADRASNKFGLMELEDIAGITFQKNGQVIRTPDRPLIQDLDELPFPAYKHFPLERYRHFGKLILPIISSRGCPFNCTFCLAPKMAGKGCRPRSPNNVVDELEWLKKEFHPDAFTFHDETFTFEKKRVIAICDEIKRRKINLPWDCSTRVDQITPELLAKMKSANCQLVSFGVESGSQQILNAMKKGTTVELNAKGIKMAKEAGLSVTISVIIGYPGETKETLQATWDFIQKTKPDDVHMSIATPYPGIELYEIMKKTGWKINEDWSHCDMQTSSFGDPNLTVDLREYRRKFYNHFYTVSYVARQQLKGTFYSKTMARAGANQILWRTKIPAILRKIM
jgi:anaerobic magnesium-protoporphyrin IX monomethyl ester cyclase